MDPVVIYGVGSPLVVDVVESCLRAGVRVAAAIRNVDGPSHVVGEIDVVEVEAADEDLRRLGVLVPLFTPRNRRLARDDAMRRGFREDATLVDPTSIVASSTTVGRGVYVNAGCTVGGAGTLGDLVLVNRGASVGHHAALGELSSIGPGAVLAGNVTLGRGAMVGAGAVVLPGVEIGDEAVVGAGAVVTRPVEARTVVVGNPARVARTGIAGLDA